MIDKWFIDDIEAVLSEHRYVVVTDARGEGEFLKKYVPEGVRLLEVKDEWSEIEAKYKAEAEYATDKVVFYVRKKADQLTFLHEYAQTAGLLQLDDMDAYVRQKLFAATGKNTNISREKLLQAARLDEGKDIRWWQSVAEGITDPMRLEEWLPDFLYAPTATRERMDDTVWNVFRSEVYRTIGKTPTEQPAGTLAGEVIQTMLQSLVEGVIDGILVTVYYQWADSTEKAEALRKHVDNYTLAEDIHLLNVHPDHPFETLDRRLMKRLSEAMKLHEDTTGIVEYVRRRISSAKAKAFKSPWLDSVLTLGTFDMKGLDEVSDLSQLAAWYQTRFARLDTAMRKIFVAWLNDEPTLRPLQEYYTSLNRQLLDRWYALEAQYEPTQQNIIAQALTDSRRTAVIVCDGLRLEIAESIVGKIKKDNVHTQNNTAFATLPSVTENGMSALFGCEQPTTSAQARFGHLQAAFPDVVTMPLDKLNDSVTAQRLVLNYGDIDQVGEKKQLGGLKDIDNYETELCNAVRTLLRLGYEKVVLTTDHGFVITGILDEADKEPRPDGVVQKVEERYVLTENALPSTDLIEREGEYFDSRYQYYARTDKPFVTRGAYGFAHGGFTPQECIIPVYEMTTEGGDYALGVKIANKADLRNVTGNYFNLKIQADGNMSDLFAQERKIKVLFFAGNQLAGGSTLLTMKPGQAITQEYELVGNIDKVVIADKVTAAQLDSCEIKRSAARDIDGLF